ncbi:hypothetical protein [Geomonas subterranea]|uniref:hypothetical protein n=1 Tax=Geomonas subterranea TaxID=2847989 RepID=UPI001CD427D8|nr:hypothetical protein [Geomonas fuzhouensis]
MKNIIRAAIKVLVLAVVTFALTGCGGATFVKGDMNPLKGGERVGVLIAKQEMKDPTKGFNGARISDEFDKEVADKVAVKLKDKLAAKGFAPVIVPADEKTTDLLKKYKNAPRNFRKVISDPESLDLGKLDELFKSTGIDILLVYEGESTIRPSAASGNVKAGVGVGTGLLLGAHGLASSGKPSTFAYTGIVERNGKFSYYNRQQFTKEGDILDRADADTMAEAVVNGWLKERK